jgi:hypothetical protein
MKHPTAIDSVASCSKEEYLREKAKEEELYLALSLQEVFLRSQLAYQLL